MPESGSPRSRPALDRASDKAKPPRKRLFVCDRCGTGMYEQNCKIICPNCGSRLDCSDLTLYFD